MLSTEGNISSILQIIMTLSIDKTLPKSSQEALRFQHVNLNSKWLSVCWLTNGRRLNVYC